MKPRKPVNIARVFDDGRRIDAAVQRAVSAARQRHKQAGLPVAEWRDGKVVWIPAEQIEEAPEANRKITPRNAPGNSSVSTAKNSSRSAKKQSRSKSK
jgi:hypothetical protein